MGVIWGIIQGTIILEGETRSSVYSSCVQYLFAFNAHNFDNIDGHFGGCQELGSSNFHFFCGPSGDPSCYNIPTSPLIYDMYIISSLFQ